MKFNYAAWMCRHCGVTNRSWVAKFKRGRTLRIVYRCPDS